MFDKTPRIPFWQQYLVTIMGSVITVIFIPIACFGGKSYGAFGLVFSVICGMSTIFAHHDEYFYYYYKENPRHHPYK